MITEKDLKEAIAECEGIKHPNANTCMKLAAFYIIREQMYPVRSTRDDLSQVGYSYSTGPIVYDSGTDFCNLLTGKDIDSVLPVLDEAMTALQVLNPPLYKSIIRKLETV